MTFSRRWLILFALGVVPLLLRNVLPGALLISLAWAFSLFLLMVIDWFLLPRKEKVQVDREVEDKLSLGAENPVRLRLHNLSEKPVRLELRDTPPDSLREQMPEAPFRFNLPAKARSAVVYQLTPKARGDYRFGDLYVRQTGPLGMAERIWSVPASNAVKVYPNIKDTEKFELMARKGRLQQVGIRAARLQGAGRDFESLRDYQPDDEMRRIDWKATARRGKLVARQYEVEKSQSVLITLDVGRTMLAEIDGVAKLDYAINAALLLAYVASLADDKVGLLVFADRVHTYLPPRKGRAQVYAILEALYNAQATLIEPDYRMAFSYLQARWRRRSLVVCFTDLWDADSSRQTIAELASLQPRHLVAAVTLLDTKILNASQQPVTTPESVYEKAVALQSLEDRARATGLLSQRGVLVVDSPADKLSAELVNRYLQVKEQMML